MIRSLHKAPAPLRYHYHSLKAVSSVFSARFPAPCHQDGSDNRFGSAAGFVVDTSDTKLTRLGLSLSVLIDVLTVKGLTGLLERPSLPS